MEIHNFSSCRRNTRVKTLHNNYIDDNMAQLINTNVVLNIYKTNVVLVLTIQNYCFVKAANG